MKIQQFSEEYIDEMAQLFMDVYSEPGYEWDLETSKKYLERDYKYFPEICLVALDDDGIVMGAVFCSIDPYYKSKMLFVDSLQVKDEYRKNGVARSLLSSVFQKAREEGFHGVHFLADERFDFPRGWYERLGFEKTNWVEYEAEMKDIKFELLK